MVFMKQKIDAACELFEANKDYLRQPATAYVAKQREARVIRNPLLAPAAILDGLRSHG